MLSHSVYLPDEATTIKIGSLLACATDSVSDQNLLSQDSNKLRTAGGIIYLQGELGSGKTTLTRGIMRGYGYQGAVKSPTYTLVEPYEDIAGNIYHFDLYRLADPAEIEYLGVEDYFLATNLCIVEWPERGFPAIPVADVTIELTVKDPGRNFVITTGTERGEKIFSRLLQLLGKEN